MDKSPKKFLHENDTKFENVVLIQIYHNNSLQIPTSENFGHFQGGGSVQNSDPSGASGGLFEKVDFTFHNILKCIDFSKLQFVVNTLYE